MTNICLDSIELGDVCMDTSELSKRIRASARHFSSCPLYEHCLNIVADNDEMVGIIAHTPKGPQPTNLFLAAVHYLLIQHPNNELAQWYESIVENPRPVETVDNAFISFCLENSDSIVAILQSRLVQTNEVARCIPLRAALAKLAEDIRVPCDFMEIGASAGLLMAFEHYHYDADGPLTDDRISSPRLTTDWEGRRLSLDPLPEFRSICGIDLNPIDIGDSDERLWLQALIWPNARYRRAQLDSACSLVEEHKIRVAPMDVNDWIEHQLKEGPQLTPLVVFHAAVRAHMPRDCWNSCLEGLVRLSGLRPVYRISMESDTEDRSGLRARSPFLLEIQHIPEPPRAIAALDGHVTWIAPL